MFPKSDGVTDRNQVTFLKLIPQQSYLSDISSKKMSTKVIFNSLIVEPLCPSCSFGKFQSHIMLQEDKKLFTKMLYFLENHFNILRLRCQK